MTKVLKIKEQIKEAMKTKNKGRLEALRLLLNALEKQKISLKLMNVEELTDSQLEDVVVKELKMLEQEKESLVAVGRDTSKVDLQIETMGEFAPVYMSDNEVEAFLKSKIEILGITSVKEKGKLMGVVSKELKGKADLGKVNKLIGELLV